jgi:RNA polymerase sigma-70 factor (ECF subfamily)
MGGNREGTQPRAALGSVITVRRGILCTDGSPLTINELFSMHYGRLVGALAVSHGLDDAADAVQDAFAAAIRRWPEVSSYDDPAGWIRHVAINNLRSRHRNETRRETILRRWWGDGRGPLASPLPGSEIAERIDLRRAILALPEKQRIAIVLHYLLELPIAQVSKELGVSEGTVKSNLHDARTSLLAHVGGPNA